MEQSGASCASRLIANGAVIFAVDSSFQLVEVESRFLSRLAWWQAQSCFFSRKFRAAGVESDWPQIIHRFVDKHGQIIVQWAFIFQ